MLEDIGTAVSNTRRSNFQSLSTMDAPFSKHVVFVIHSQTP